MAQEQGSPYRRHGPSAALRTFLDPLQPGGYFDCGRARLHGLDDALLDEARKRGREVGDDDFQLVATDTGLVFCRPSISFAIAARWEELALTRPRGEDPVVLPVTWPNHGELKFTVSKRLAGNIFRRWLELRMQAARQARYPAPITPAGGLPIVVSEVPLDWSGTPAGNRSTQGVEPSPTRTVLLDADRPVRLDADRPVLLDADRPDAIGRAREPVEPVVPAPRVLPRSDRVSDRMSDRARDGVTGEGTDEAAPGSMADRELRRLPRPVPDRGRSWRIGSLRSLVGGVALVSTAVVIVTVGTALLRQGSSSIPESTPTPGGDPAAPLVVDHTRFRPDAIGSDSADGRLENPVDAANGGENPVDAANGDEEASAGFVGGPAALSSADSVVGLPGSPTDAVAGASTPSVGGAAAGLDPSTQAQLLACDRNYSGCVPDPTGLEGSPGVDCADRGPGPFFVTEPVVVMGTDIHGLDDDGDGLACEIEPSADG